jgi:hypothetical protein
VTDLAGAQFPGVGGGSVVRIDLPLNEQLHRVDVIRRKDPVDVLLGVEPDVCGRDDTNS